MNNLIKCQHGELGPNVSSCSELAIFKHNITGLLFCPEHIKLIITAYAISCKLVSYLDDEDFDLPKPDPEKDKKVEDSSCGEGGCQ